MTFKSEEEVKEFLVNIGTEYRFSCFHEKNSEGCHLLGDYLEAVKRDFEGAEKVYQNNCDDLKYPKSCYKYANYKYLGRGCTKDLATAFDYYTKACELGSADGCLQCGAILTEKKENPDDASVIKNDFVTGLKYLEKSCAMGNASACYIASGLYIMGKEGIPKDKSRAAELSKTACEGRNLYACMNLSQMYRKGDGVEKDEKKAQLFKQMARDIRDDTQRKPSIGLQQYS